MKRICSSVLLAIGLLVVLGASLPNGQQAFALNSSVLYGSATGATAAARPPVPVNVARNRPVFCPSIENTCVLCWNAVDGNPATRWSSQFSDPQWITVDLGAPTRVERVILRWETAYAQIYRIQTSRDAVTWTDVYSTTAGDGGVDDLAVSGSGRYVRMVGTQRATERGYSLFEFEVYGRSSTVNLPLIFNQRFPAPTPTPTLTVTPRPISILVDDFSPQPNQGEQVYFFNRLDGNRGAINDSVMTWGRGQVTTTIAPGNRWGGGWMSLNHPISEGLPISFSAILPAQVLPPYQSQITGITARIVRGAPGRTFRLELKGHDVLPWTGKIVLNGGEQVVSFDLLPTLGNRNELDWVLDGATGGDAVVLDSIAFTATTQITDTATAAFVWSYAQLLSNWNPETGLVRDKARDASGEFDAVQATGSLAAATAQAEQLGIIARADAIRIVNKISHTLLAETPRFPSFHGLWPHFVRVSSGGAISIVPGQEWSSVDTVIAAIGLLAAQNGLELPTTATEQKLRDIDWVDLVKPEGMISMGYTYQGERISAVWDTFGGESWLVELAYASATGQVAPLTYPSPPTANGSGFIDELAWNYLPPPASPDYWGTDWAAYRSAAADKQIRYYTSNYPTACFSQVGLFGLSAAEVPDPSLVPPDKIYQTFGVGGRDRCANDGFELLGAPVVVPHYPPMIASLRPDEAIRMWDWLIEKGFFTPLNNVESLMFSPGAPCDPAGVVWNQMKGSWNLALQTLALGRTLAQRQGHVPILWQAVTENPLLRDGYHLLAPSEPSPTPAPTQGIALAPTPTPSRASVQVDVKPGAGNGTV